MLSKIFGSSPEEKMLRLQTQTLDKQIADINEQLQKYQTNNELKSSIALKQEEVKKLRKKLVALQSE